MGVSPFEVGRLTRAEIRVLLEGERVDERIDALIDRVEQAGGIDEAMGTVVPRQSDLEVLEQFEEEHGNPRRN